MKDAMLLRIAPLLLLALLLVACGSDGGGAPPEPTSTSGAPTRTSGAPTATASEARCRLDQDLPIHVATACDAMAEQFGRSPDGLVSVTNRQWPSSCLGAAEPGEVCDDVEVRGYEIVFVIGNVHYTYHTDEHDTVRLAGFEIVPPTPSAGEPTPLPPAPGRLVVRGPEPVAFDFTPDGRLFFTLRQEGKIGWVDLKELETGKRYPDGLSPELFAELDVFRGSECGLLGVAVDPDFDDNHYIYTYAIQPDSSTKDAGKPRVIRYKDDSGKGTDPKVIIDDLPLTNPVTCAHVGGNLHFGPDGYLYLSIGNYEARGSARDLSSPLGSILRFDKSDGSAAADNPFVGDPSADPRIFAYGLRNPWDFAFHPRTGKIYAPDNGPGECDELNIIEAGSYYGMPHPRMPEDGKTCFGRGGVEPIYYFSLPGTEPWERPSNVAPAGVAFLPGGVYPGLDGGLLVCEFLTRFLRYLEFEGPSQDRVAKDIVLIQGCRFNVNVDGDGIIYFSYDNAIFRLSPEALANAQ